MLEVWQNHFTEFVALFVIIDPIGSTSIFLALTGGMTPAEQRRVAFKSILVSAIILVAFAIAGRLLLGGMGISISSFQIAGGIVLLIFGLDMVFEFVPQHKLDDAQGKRDVAIYPLAMPAIAGPGTIMAVVLLSDDDRGNIIGQSITILVLLVILAVTYVMFRLAMILHRFIGHTGAHIAKKIMGLLLAAVAVDRIITGIIAYLPHPPA